MRVKNIIESFTDFTFDDLDIEEQEFNDYRSKYLDLWQKVKSDNQKEKVSILDDVDFELELIHRDEINVTYILQLLVKLKGAVQEDVDKQSKAIFDMLGGEVQLRSKKELIEKFIKENLPNIEKSEEVENEFETFWDEEKKKGFVKICDEEKLAPEKFLKIVDSYIFTGRKPLRDDVVIILNEKPKLLERKKIVERVVDRMVEFVDTFIDGMVGE